MATRTRPPRSSNPESEPAENPPLPEPGRPLRLLPTLAEPKSRRSPLDPDRSVSRLELEPEPEQPVDEFVKTEGPTLGPGVSTDGGPDFPGFGSGSAPATRTTESIPADPVKARNTSKLVANILRMVVVTAEKLLSRNGRDFRRPTDAQIMGVARPVARIAVRHLDVSWLSDDLNDVIEAGGEVSGYMLEGPVAPRRDWEQPESLVGMEKDIPTFPEPTVAQPFPTEPAPRPQYLD